MKVKFFLSMVALAAFAALPAFAQHGHGGGASGSMHGSSSMHGDDHSSTHGKSDDHDMDHDRSHSHGGSISQKLASNTKLASKLQSLLPAGTDLNTAASGFKNLGQFVAAVHVSHNLGIPFDQLKSKMLGPPSESLGKAISQLQPAANAKAETKKAESEAKDDMKSSS
jgi:ABC-type Zn2+ transport system substrate-binding protein/surface adhesin